LPGLVAPLVVGLVHEIQINVITYTVAMYADTCKYDKVKIKSNAT